MTFYISINYLDEGLAVRLEIFLSTSLACKKAFYSSVIYTWYKACEISIKQFFSLSIAFTTISSELEEDCLSYGEHLTNISLIK